jgi:hypothetical protein
MTYRRAKTALRKVPPLEIQAVRRDHAARTRAVKVRREMAGVLRSTPTLTQHAKRLQVNVNCLKQIVRGQTYKELPYPGY